MIQTSYNPDVLSCLANLSNDEVFTPPNLANQILDLLPNSIWSDKNAKFLDPVSKSGVVSQFIYSHHITKESFSFVPIFDMAKPWTDEKRYAKYGLTAEEIAFIESMIRPMVSSKPEENGA